MYICIYVCILLVTFIFIFCGDTHQITLVMWTKMFQIFFKLPQFDVSGQILIVSLIHLYHPQIFFKISEHSHFH